MFLSASKISSWEIWALLTVDFLRYSNRLLLRLHYPSQLLLQTTKSVLVSILVLLWAQIGGETTNSHFQINSVLLVVYITQLKFNEKFWLQTNFYLLLSSTFIYTKLGSFEDSVGSSVSRTLSFIFYYLLVNRVVIYKQNKFYYQQQNIVIWYTVPNSTVCRV